MKRLTFLIVITIAVLGMAAFAAAPAKTTAKTAPTVKAPAAPVVAQPAKTGGWIFGVEGGSPYLRFKLSEVQAVDVGATYTNTNAANNNLGVWGRYNHQIAEISSIKTSWGLELHYDTGKAAAADCTVISGIGLLSAAFDIVPNVTVYGNINLVTITQTTLAGASSTAYTAIVGSANAYSGIRVTL